MKKLTDEINTAADHLLEQRTSPSCPWRDADRDADEERRPIVSEDSSITPAIRCRVPCGAGWRQTAVTRRSGIYAAER
jgi:hypothetical protein